MNNIKSQSQYGCFCFVLAICFCFKGFKGADCLYAISDVEYNSLIFSSPVFNFTIFAVLIFYYSHIVFYSHNPWLVRNHFTMLFYSKYFNSYVDLLIASRQTM